MADIKLPEVGEGVESGTVVALLVKVGDNVEVDTPLLELETDKAVVEVPSSVAGVVESILVNEGDEIPIGQIVLTIGEGAPSAPIATEDNSSDNNTDASVTSSVIDVSLPEVGEGIETGTVVALLVAVGDTVKEDDAILELETDKAVVEMPSPHAGTIIEILVAEGTEAAIGQVVVRIETSATPSNASTTASTTAPKEEAKPEPAVAAVPEPKVEKQLVTVGAEIPNRQTIPAAPSVRRMAREQGIDINQVMGSGVLGRISAQDLTNHANGGGHAMGSGHAMGIGASSTTGTGRPNVKLPDFTKWGEVDVKPMSGIHKATARQMDLSWSNIPHVTQHDKCDITNFEKLRKGYAKRVDATGGGKLTPTAIIAKIVATALEKFPNFNASIDVDNQQVIYKNYVNVGIAVDTPRGLVVPNIRNTNQKSITEISGELNALASKARDGKTSMDEMQGTTFTITNLGGIGGIAFTPIVNSPEVAILGVSRAQWEPRLNDDGEFEPRLMMTLSLSYDHRMINGAEAARFTRWLCEAIEEPFVVML